MKNRFNYLFPLIFAFTFPALLWIGCKKTTTPLGVTAPNGFDFPTQTPVPLPGQITASILDYGVTVNGPAIAGLTVIAQGPTGEAYSNTTNASGQAIWQFPNIKPGIWTVSVAPTTVYALSQLPVTITSSSAYASVSFVWAANPLTLTSNSTSTFNPLVQSTDYYTVTDSQGSLNVPISLTTVGLPINWAGGFTPPSMGSPVSVGSAQVTVSSLGVTIPSCPNSDDVFFFVKGTRNDGISILSSYTTIGSNPQMAATATWGFQMNCNSNCCSMPSGYAPNLAITFLSNIPSCYSMSISLTDSHGLNTGFTFSQATTQTITWPKADQGLFNNSTINYVINNCPNGPVSGSFGVSSTNTTCFIDGSNGSITFNQNF